MRAAHLVECLVNSVDGAVFDGILSVNILLMKLYQCEERKLIPARISQRLADTILTILNSNQTVDSVQLSLLSK